LTKLNRTVFIFRTVKDNAEREKTSTSDYFIKCLSGSGLSYYRSKGSTMSTVPRINIQKVKGIQTKRPLSMYWGHRDLILQNRYCLVVAKKY